MMAHCLDCGGSECVCRSARHLREAEAIIASFDQFVRDHHAYGGSEAMYRGSAFPADVEKVMAPAWKWMAERGVDPKRSR